MSNIESTPDGLVEKSSGRKIESPLDIPDFNFKGAYMDMRKVFDHPCVEKALKFASMNPNLVFKEGTFEYDAVCHGFFDLYLSMSRSTADVVGA